MPFPAGIAMLYRRGESPKHYTDQMKLFNAIAAAAVIGTSFIAASPAFAECRFHGASLRSERTARFSVTNYRRYPVNLIWINFNGNRKLYNTIGSGETFTQPTFASHMWVIEEEGSNRCLTNIRLGMSNQDLTLR